MGGREERGSFPAGVGQSADGNASSDTKAGGTGASSVGVTRMTTCGGALVCGTRSGQAWMLHASGAGGARPASMLG